MTCCESLSAGPASFQHLCRISPEQSSLVLSNRPPQARVRLCLVGPGYHGEEGYAPFEHQAALRSRIHGFSVQHFGLQVQGYSICDINSPVAS